MRTRITRGIETTRDQLLKQYIMSKGTERTLLLSRILDLDEEIEDQTKNEAIN